MYSPATTIQIINFIRSIGIAVDFALLKVDTLLPGIAIQNGGIIIDSEKLKHPGDLLLVAGHIALTPTAQRHQLLDDTDWLAAKNGEGVATMAWAYAACLHTGLDTRIAFHDESYKVVGTVLIDAFNNGGYIGIPLLQACNMAYNGEKAAELNVQPYPYMVNWLSQL